MNKRLTESGELAGSVLMARPGLEPGHHDSQSCRRPSNGMENACKWLLRVRPFLESTKRPEIRELRPVRARMTSRLPVGSPRPFGARRGGAWPELSRDEREGLDVAGFDGREVAVIEGCDLVELAALGECDHGCVDDAEGEILVLVGELGNT